MNTCKPFGGQSELGTVSNEGTAVSLLKSLLLKMSRGVIDDEAIASELANPTDIVRRSTNDDTHLSNWSTNANVILTNASISSSTDWTSTDILDTADQLAERLSVLHLLDSDTELTPLVMTPITVCVDVQDCLLTPRRSYKSRVRGSRLRRELFPSNSALTLSA